MVPYIHSSLVIVPYIHSSLVIVYTSTWQQKFRVSMATTPQTTALLIWMYVLQVQSWLWHTSCHPEHHNVFANIVHTTFRLIFWTWSRKIGTWFCLQNDQKLVQSVPQSLGAMWKINLMFLHTHWFKIKSGQTDQAEKSWEELNDYSQTSMK